MVGRCLFFWNLVWPVLKNLSFLEFVLRHFCAPLSVFTSSLVGFKSEEVFWFLFRGAYEAVCLRLEQVGECELKVLCSSFSLRWAFSFPSRGEVALGVPDFLNLLHLERSRLGVLGVFLFSVELGLTLWREHRRRLCNFVLVRFFWVL